MASVAAIAAGGIVKGASSLAGASSQADALKSQGAFKEAQAETNARLLETQADATLRRGDSEAAQIRKAGKAAAGAGKVAAAASGVDVSSGSAAVLQQESATMSQYDAMTAKNNAWREAWGYRVTASDTRAQGKMAGRAATNEARSTLATGGLQAVSAGFEAGSTISGIGKSRR